ncbi:MAG: EF-hand domain-containing protein [Sphingomonas sp.]
MKSLLLAAMLVGTTLAGAAMAQSQTGTVQDAAGRGMMRADTDGDGRISRVEAMTEADARFARMDANGDGKLCGDENMRHGRHEAPPADGTMPPPTPARGTAKADTDGDGCVSRDEFRAGAMRRFERLDTNHDGFIDAAERQAMSDRMTQMRQRRQGGDVAPPSPQDPGQ